MPVDIGPLEPAAPPRDCPFVLEIPQTDSPDNAAELVATFCRQMQAVFDRWRSAEEALSACKQGQRELKEALTASPDEGTPSGWGEALKIYLKNKRQILERIVAARGAIPPLLERLRGEAMGLEQALAALKQTLERTGSQVLMAGVDYALMEVQQLFGLVAHPQRVLPRKAASARALAHQLLEKVHKQPEYYRQAAATVEQDSAYVETRKPAPARSSFDPLLKALSAALYRAIDSHGKTAMAKYEALAAVAIVEGLEEERFREPKKPSSEEVARYLQQVECWGRKYLPAQRAAAEHVLNFRKHLSGVWLALKAVTPCLRKVAYLERLAVDPEVEALVAGARAVLEKMQASTREWDRLADSWRRKQFDGSKPVLDPDAQESELIQAVQRQIKNVGVALANKWIAYAKWEQLKVEEEDKPLECPNLWSSSEFDFSGAFAAAEKFVANSQEVNWRIERHRAKLGMAWDAFEARQEMLRQAANSCARECGVIEKTLKQPMSDELRVFVLIARKLKSLHGEYLN